MIYRLKNRIRYCKTKRFEKQYDTMIYNTDWMNNKFLPVDGR